MSWQPVRPRFYNTWQPPPQQQPPPIHRAMPAFSQSSAAISRVEERSSSRGGSEASAHSHASSGHAAAKAAESLRITVGNEHFVRGPVSGSSAGTPEVSGIPGGADLSNLLDQLTQYSNPSRGEDVVNLQGIGSSNLGSFLSTPQEESGQSISVSEMLPTIDEQQEAYELYEKWKNSQYQSLEEKFRQSKPSETKIVKVEQIPRGLSQFQQETQPRIIQHHQKNRQTGITFDNAGGTSGYLGYFESDQRSESLNTMIEKLGSSLGLSTDQIDLLHRTMGDKQKPMQPEHSDLHLEDLLSGDTTDYVLPAETVSSMEKLLNQIKDPLATSEPTLLQAPTAVTRSMTPQVESKQGVSSSGKKTAQDLEWEKATQKFEEKLKAPPAKELEKKSVVKRPRGQRSHSNTSGSSSSGSSSSSSPAPSKKAISNLTQDPSTIEHTKSKPYWMYSTCLRQTNRIFSHLQQNNQ